MRGGFASKQRAEEFDRLLSSPAASERAGEYADLLEVVSSLRDVPEVTARPEFVASLRTRLVAAAERQPVRVVDDATAALLTPRQRAGARERRFATVLGGFAVVAATSSMAMASQGALPGDVLYPVKRAIENAGTNLKSDDAAKAESLMAHAEQRLQEVEALAARGDSDDADEIAATLQDFTDQTNQAAELTLGDYATNGDSAPVDGLRTFTSRSMSELSTLGEQVPGDARPSLITAAQTVLQADNAAFQVCPTCGEGGVTDLPEFATRSLELPNTLLDGGPTPDSIITAGPGDDFLRNVEKEARKHGGKSGPSGTTGETTEQPPPRSTETDKPDPLDKLEDTINDSLGGDDGGSSGGKKGDPSKPLGEVTTSVTNVVNGITGLVTGLLN